MAKLQEFILNYAADHDMDMIDLNWLMNDNDRRLGPIFVGQTNQTDNPVRAEPKAVSKELPQHNATRWHENIDIMVSPESLTVVGEAAADVSHGSRAGIFPDDALSIWDEVEIPTSTRMVKIKGESMAPVLLDGQYAMVGTEYISHNVPKDREIVVAEVKVVNEEQAGSDRPWEGVYCKRVSDGGDVWIFQSINTIGDMFSIAKDNCRLWPVIGVWFAGRGKPPEED